MTTHTSPHTRLGTGPRTRTTGITRVATVLGLVLGTVCVVTSGVLAASQTPAAASTCTPYKTLGEVTVLGYAPSWTPVAKSAWIIDGRPGRWFKARGHAKMALAATVKVKATAEADTCPGGSSNPQVATITRFVHPSVTKDAYRTGLARRPVANLKATAKRRAIRHSVTAAKAAATSTAKTRARHQVGLAAIAAAQDASSAGATTSPTDPVVYPAPNADQVAAQVLYWTNQYRAHWNDATGTLDDTYQSGLTQLTTIAPLTAASANWANFLGDRAVVYDIWALASQNCFASGASTNCAHSGIAPGLAHNTTTYNPNTPDKYDVDRGTSPEMTTVTCQAGDNGYGFSEVVAGFIPFDRSLPTDQQADDTARSMVDAWFSEGPGGGHHDVMVRADLVRTGIGVAIRTDSQGYAQAITVENVTNTACPAVA